MYHSENCSASTKWKLVKLLPKYQFPLKTSQRKVTETRMEDDGRFCHQQIYQFYYLMGDWLKSKKTTNHFWGLWIDVLLKYTSHNVVYGKTQDTNSRL